jgi:hypothetical protein
MFEVIFTFNFVVHRVIYKNHIFRRAPSRHFLLRYPGLKGSGINPQIYATNVHASFTTSTDVQKNSTFSRFVVNVVY